MKLFPRVLLLLALLALTLPGCSPAAAPAPKPAELSIEEHPLSRQPQAEYGELYFSEGDSESILAVHADERANTFERPAWVCTPHDRLGFCASLGGAELTAYEDYGSGIFGLFSSGSVVLERDGKQVYRIKVGDASPVSALRSLWIVNGQWVLETAKVSNHTEDNIVKSIARGQITVAGMLPSATRPCTANPSISSRKTARPASPTPAWRCRSATTRSPITAAAAMPP
jgi:hypothetical protein